jgi:hypothetical protein
VKQSVFKRVSAAYLRAQKIEVSDHLGGVRPSIYGLENCGCVSEVSERLRFRNLRFRNLGTT